MPKKSFHCTDRVSAQLRRELGAIVHAMEIDDDLARHLIEHVEGSSIAFFHGDRVLGSAETVNQSLEKVQRVADFFELAELMCRDALMREESCGGHFRTEHQFFDSDPEVQAGSTQAGEAKRHDDKFSYVSCWEYKGEGVAPVLHKEALVYESVHASIRSYA